MYRVEFSQFFRGGGGGVRVTGLSENLGTCVFVYFIQNIIILFNLRYLKHRWDMEVDKYAH